MGGVLWDSPFSFINSSGGRKMAGTTYAQEQVATDIQYQSANLKQPVTDNYLMNNSFKLNIERIPHVSYFCQRANIPNISFNIVEQPTPYGVKVYKSGSSYDYSELEISFVVDEKMKNWLEIYHWMRSLSNAEDGDEFIPFHQHTSSGEIIVITSAYRPILAVTFEDLFPINLSGIDFDSTTTETEAVIASATFRYRSYTIQEVDLFD